MQNTLFQAILEIERQRPQNVAILTGAGVSAESGIPTFRDPGGLWEGFRPEELATPEAFHSDPSRVWRWYEWRRDTIRAAEPNEAHRALVRLEQAAPSRCTLITQNVDSLHRRAGSRNLIELHGNIFRARCTREQKTVALEERLQQIPPHCGCGAMLRPDIVWFGEPLHSGDLDGASEAIAASDLLLVVGTSGLVYPAAGLVNHFSGILSIEVNPNASALSGRFDMALSLPAAEAVPLLVEAILRGWS